MVKVTMRFTKPGDPPSRAYISFVCLHCGRNIVSFRALHSCYSCKSYVVSGGLLVQSEHYRFNYHIGKLDDQGGRI